MAWEWLAPASAVAGAFVGGGTTWLVSRGARKHAEALADKNHAHAERMANQTRQQKRLEDAYVGMLQAVQTAGHWADSLLPIFDADSPQTVPELPSTEEQQRLHALVMAYGSDQVNTLINRYISIIADLQITHDRLVHVRSQPECGEDDRPFVQQLRVELLPAEKATRRELRQQVAGELRTPMRD